MLLCDNYVKAMTDADLSTLKFQQILSTISGPVAESMIISTLVCGQNDHAFQAELIGTSVFMSGLCTLLQVTFGLRLL